VLFLILMLIGHIMACCWYMVSDVEQRKDNVLVDGWVKREGWGPTCEDLACWDGPGTCDAGDEGLTWEDLGTPCVPRATKVRAAPSGTDRGSVSLVSVAFSMEHRAC
jgi:hypothetical protein